MGNRAECPSCKAYSSNVYADLSYGDDCRSCGCPNNLLVKWEEMQPTLEKLAQSKCDKDLLNKVKEQEETIAKLTTKITKLESIFCWTDVLDPLLKAKEILENNID